MQVYCIPRGLLSENILRSVGNSVGKFIRMDTNALDGVWKPYTRIRVMINVEKPLKRRLKIKREGDSWNWVNFKYEQLGTFCFVCGILGHSERDCNIIYENPDKVVDKAYGVWLRAPSKNATKSNAGARWLRTTSDGRSSWMKMNNKESMAHTGHGEGQEQPRFMEVDGVVREINGETGGVAVKGRDPRANEKDMIMQIMDGHNANEDVGRDNMETTKIVFDSKRKRREDKEAETKEGNQDGVTLENQIIVPLNLRMAGPVVQARQGS